MRDRNRVGMWVMGVMGALLLIGGIAWLVYDRQQVAEARDWPSVPGQITSSYVGVERSGGRRNRTRYVPHVEYNYAVGGTTYSNHYIWLTSTHSFSSRESAQDALRDYGYGATVRVYYSPADPRRSALRIESDPILGLIFVPVGLLLLGIAWWMKRRMGVAMPLSP